PISKPLLRIRRRVQADTPDSLRLLCLGGERRGEDCSQPSDEGAAVHSISWSARSSSDSGMVIPNALAVLRLTTRSNFVGCSIGRSEGLAPLRILSTKVAARRNMSGRLTPYDNRPPASVTSRNVDTVAS